VCNELEPEQRLRELALFAGAGGGNGMEDFE